MFGMIIFELVFSFLLFGSANIANNSITSDISMYIWFMVSALVWIIYFISKSKVITKADIERMRKEQEYKEKYFNDFGEMP